MKKFLSKFIGDKRFYKMVLTVAVPIMIQNGITNFVGLLDNIMVGSVGTEQMTGVAIVNQLLMVFNLSIFGAISGPGIFGAQFYGSANLFNVVFIALGSAVSIVVGQLLGAGKMEEAVDTDNKLIAFTVMSCFGMGGLLFLCAPLFPMVYNTTPEVKELATNFICVSAICMPLYGFTHAAYFTLRSGGKTVITFLFDSFFVWVGCIPAAYVLSRYSPLTPVLLYFACQSMDWIKCVIGFILVKKRVWVRRLVADNN